MRTPWQPVDLTWIGSEKIKKPLLHGPSFICFFTAPVETWPHEFLLKPGLLNWTSAYSLPSALRRRFNFSLMNFSVRLADKQARTEQVEMIGSQGREESLCELPLLGKEALFRTSWAVVCELLASWVWWSWFNPQNLCKMLGIGGCVWNPCDSKVGETREFP